MPARKLLPRRWQFIIGEVGRHSFLLPPVSDVVPLHLCNSIARCPPALGQASPSHHPTYGFPIDGVIDRIETLHATVSAREYHKAHARKVGVRKATCLMTKVERYRVNAIDDPPPDPKRCPAVVWRKNWMVGNTFPTQCSNKAGHGGDFCGTHTRMHLRHLIESEQDSD